MPTALRTLQLRSSRAHSDRRPAVEVQQCPLRAEVGEERRVGKAEVDVEVEAEVVSPGMGNEGKSLKTGGKCRKMKEIVKNPLNWRKK